MQARMHTALRVASRLMLVISIASAVGTAASAQSPPSTVSRIVVTSHVAGDSLSHASATQTGRHLGEMAGAMVRVVPSADVHAIFLAAYGQPTLTKDLSASELRELGKLLRAQYVIDVVARRGVRGIELAVTRLSTRAPFTSVPLASIRGASAEEVGQILAARLAADSAIAPRRLE